MLELLLIGVVYLLLNLLLLNNLFLLLFVLVLVPVVVFDHHHTLLLVVPSGLGFFLVALLLSDKEGLRKGPVNHHDETFDCKEAWIVLFGQIVKRFKFFHFLLQLVLQLVEVLILLLLEFLVTYSLVQLDIT